MVRRLEQGVIEVTFGAPIPEASERGAALLELAKKPDTHLVRSPAGFLGVVAKQKDYMGYLRDVSAPKEEVRSILAALDDSRKARRARMRG